MKPLKIVIFYFSGTGNTWWTAERLAEYFRTAGHDVACLSVERVTTKTANDLIACSNIVGFGYPVYGSDLPEPMKTFMQSLVPTEKNTFIFCTQWLWSGDGARTATEFLPFGFRVKWAEHFFMPNNVSVSVIRLPFTNDKNRINKVLRKTKGRIDRFSRRILSNRRFLRGFTCRAFYLGYLQRRPFRHAYIRLKDDIGVDREKCARCGYCVKLCPSDNLILEHDAVRTKGNCILCLRCYSFCPLTAVTYMKRPHLLQRGEPYRGPVDGFDPTILCGEE